MTVALELPGAERVGGEEMNGGWKASQWRGTAALGVESKRIRKGREIETVFFCARVREWGARVKAMWHLHLGSAQAVTVAARNPLPPRCAPRPLGFNPYEKALLLLASPTTGRVWAREPAAGGETKGVPVGSDVPSNSKRPLLALCLGEERFEGLSRAQSLPSHHRVLPPVSSWLTGALLFLFWEAKHQCSSPLSLPWENKQINTLRKHPQCTHVCARQTCTAECWQGLDLPPRSHELASHPAASAAEISSSQQGGALLITEDKRNGRGTPELGHNVLQRQDGECGTGQGLPGRALLPTGEMPLLRLSSGSATKKIAAPVVSTGS